MVKESLSCRASYHVWGKNDVVIITQMTQWIKHVTGFTGRHKEDKRRAIILYTENMLLVTWELIIQDLQQ